MTAKFDQIPHDDNTISQHDPPTARPEPESYRSAARYRAFAEHSTEGIWMLEADEPIPTDLSEDEQVDRLVNRMYLAECNPAMARMYGLSGTHELIGSRLAGILPLDDPANESFLRAFIRSGYSLTDAESVEYGDDGSAARYFSHSLLGVIENGALLGAWGTQRDITRQKRAEEALRTTAETLHATVDALRASESALREREARFLRLADAAPAMIWMTDRVGNGTYFNRAWLHFRGRGLGAEMGSGYVDGIHAEDLPRVMHTVQRAGRALQPFTAEYRMRGRDGTYHWLLARGVPLFEPDGSLAGYVGSCLDVTGRKRVRADKAALHREQRRFLREMLAGLTGGRLCLCDDRLDLPTPPENAIAFPSVRLVADSLGALRLAVRAAADAAAIPTERFADLLIGVGEASMNAVVHAGGGEGIVYADPSAGRIQVWITDRGRGIAEDSLHRATLERGFTTAGTLGHGFWMILRTVDRLWLLTGAGGTTAVLEQGRVETSPPWMEGL